MISKEEKEKQRMDLNRFIEQNVKGINKTGLFVNVAARGRHANFFYSLDILFNEFIQVLSVLFLFPFAYHPRESLFHLLMMK